MTTGIERGSTGDTFTWDGNLAVGGNAAVTGTMAVTGNTTITGNLTVGGSQIKKASYSFTGVAAAGVDTGIALPAGTLVYDVFVVVGTGDSGKTLNVGTGALTGTPNEFLAAVSLTSTGFISGYPVWTVGSTNDYWTGSKLGSALAGGYTAGGDNSTPANVGEFYRAPAYISTTTTLKIKPSALTVAVGSVIIVYV